MRQENVCNTDAQLRITETRRLFAFFIITSYLCFVFLVLFFGIFPSQRIVHVITSNEIGVKHLQSFLVKRVTQKFGK